MWTTRSRFLSTYPNRSTVSRRMYSVRPARHQVYVFGTETGGTFEDMKPRNRDFRPRLVEPWDGYQIASVHASWQQHFIVTTDHKVFAWGLNDAGQLATVHVPKTELTWPHRVQALSPVKILWIEPGRVHTLALTDEGRVLAFGSQEFGQLGDGVAEQSISGVPVPIEALRKYKIVQVAVGLDHSIALADTGEVFAWGFNRDYQLGLNIEEDMSVPTRVRGMNKEIKKIVAGLDYNFALSTPYSSASNTASLPTYYSIDATFAEGDFYAWGSGESWQLGNGERDVKSSPILNSIPGEKVQDITAGGTSSVAITESGNIYSWGLGMCGRLGHGTTEDSPLPKRMEFWDQIDSKVVKICGKGGHNVAMTGELYSWGFGGDGRLGHGNEDDQCLPKKIEFFADKKVVTFTTGLDYCLVVVEE